MANKQNFLCFSAIFTIKKAVQNSIFLFCSRSPHGERGLKYYNGDIKSLIKIVAPTAADARATLRHSAKLDRLEGAYAAAADINGNANITAANARSMLRVSAKLDKYKF